MTHDELVEKAWGWLRGRCKLVCVNAKPFSCKEHADAIGWAVNGESIVVECKVSLEDFRADSYKKWRTTSKGMGWKKYYLVPQEISGRVYTGHGIGLLVAKGNGCHVVKEAEARQDRDWSQEICLLLSQITNPTANTGEVTDIEESK